VETGVGFDVPPPPPNRNLLTLHSPAETAEVEPTALRALPVPVAAEDITVADIDLVRRFRRRPR